MAIPSDNGGMPVYDPSQAVAGTGGGGMATNTLNSAAVSPSDDWLTSVRLYVGSHKNKGFVTPPQTGVGVTRAGAGDFGHYGGGGKAPITLTPFQLLQAFDSFDRKDYLKFKNMMIAAGLVTTTNDDPQTVRDTYEAVLKQVAFQQASGAGTLTPMGYIENLIRLNGQDPSKIGSSDSASASQAKDTTYTQKSVYDLNPAQARQTLEQALQQELGRAPTHAEIEDFVSAVQTHAAADPTTVTTHYHTDAQGNTVASQSTDSGFGAENVANMAERVGKNNPDYKSYQAVSTYFPALQQALGATI